MPDGVRVLRLRPASASQQWLAILSLGPVALKHGDIRPLGVAVSGPGAVDADPGRRVRCARHPGAGARLPAHRARTPVASR